MSGALDGVRVVDLTAGLAGPMTGMLLADAGADVVHVVPADGDPEADRPGAAMWHRGKRRLRLDPATDAGRARLSALLDGADVLLVNDGLRPLERAADDGVDRPALVRVRMPALLGEPRWARGEDSPALLAAITGTALRQNSSSGAPVDPVFPWTSYVHAAWAAACTTAALLERERSGLGQTVLVGGAHGAMVASTMSLLIDPGTPEQPADNGPGGPNPLYTRYRCGDGSWIFLAPLTPHFQVACIAVLGLQDMVDDPRVAGDLTALSSPANRGWVRGRIADVLATRPAEEWLALLRENDVPVGPLGDRDDWLDSPEAAAVGARAEVEDPERGTVVMPAFPLHLSRTPARTAAPEVEGDPEWAPRDAAPAAGATDRPPLDGIRVLDLGAVLAGPYTGTLLADLGAEVVKVEVPAGDSWRDRGWSFIRGQRGLAVDLRSPGGHAAFLDLVAGADVVVDNYRAGVLGRLAIDHARLVAVRPDLVTASITGYGEGTPFSAAPAFDPLLQARSGMMTAQGGPDEPVQMNVAVNDVTTAALTTFGVVAALLHRARTGEGQHVEATLAATAAYAQSEELVRYAGRVPAPRGGSDFAGPAPLDRAYRVRDGWVRVQAAPDDREGLAAAGLVDAADPATDETRLTAALGGLDRATALVLLEACGVPAAPERRIAELPADPEYRAAGVFAAVPRPALPPLLAPGRYARFSRTERTDVLVPCGVGEHTRAVLADAGLTAEEIAALEASGAVRQGEGTVPQVFAAYR